MPIFTIQSPSGRSYDIGATSEEHAADYVARRFFSGFEEAGNSFDEPDARLLGPFSPARPKQEDQQDVAFQDYLNSFAPAPAPEEPQVPSQPLPHLPHVPWANRMMPSSPLQRLARLRAGFRSPAPPGFLLRLKGYR